MDQEIKAALERFVVDNQALEALEAKLAQFNIFEAIGMVRQEIRHSNFLAFLLNPSGTHRLNDVFLKWFLKRFLLNAEKSFVSPIEIDVANLADAEVWREWKNIDILIHCPSSKIVCAIENKVGSQEHSNQLEKYREIVLQKFSDYRHIFIYLTSTGEDPLTGQGKEFWAICSYEMMIDLIEDTCQKYQSTIGTEVYTLMNHYVALIRRHVVKDIEIVELCRKIYKQHKQALDLIYEYGPNLGLEIAEFAEKLIQQTKGLECDFHMKGKTQKLIRFTVPEWDNLPFQKTCEKWTGSKRILLFQVQAEPPSVYIDLWIGPGELKNRQAIADALSTTSLPGTQNIQLGNGKGWTQIFKRSCLENVDLGSSMSEIQVELEQQWQKFLLEDLPVIKAAIAQKFAASN